jgi:hypothetical protein
MATKTKVPPIVNCKPIVRKDNRTLVWLHDAIPNTKIESYDGIVTSVTDMVKWHKKANILALVLMECSAADFEVLRKHKCNLFISRAVFEQQSREQWVSLGVSIGILEELADQFPVVQSPWSADLVDGIACVSLMLHYNTLYLKPGSVLTEARQTQFTQNGVTMLTDYVPPPQIWLLTQYFVHDVTKRAKEIRQCLKNNMACKWLDRIVLLNEKDLKYEWSGSKGSEKIEQKVIGTRLTYKDLLKHTFDNIPPNTIVIYANADIYCNDTLKQLYSVKMEDALFALLRWDEQSGPEDLKLFGPRPDSQDAWICKSEAIQKRTWTWDSFNYKLGTAGCDNRFTGDMFGMRFAVSNPCQTIQTVHIHKTAIRNYNPTDIVPARLYMYVHPCGLVELDQAVEGPQVAGSLSPRSTSVTIKGLHEKKIQTYCIMLARENRFKWSEVGPTAQSLSPLKLYKWSDSFVTNAGIVYDYKKVYLGPIEKSNDFIQKVGRDLSISYVHACDRAPSMLAIPCAQASSMTNVDMYCLHYLSYALQIYAQLEPGHVPSLFVLPQIVPTLQSLVLQKGLKGVVPAVIWNPTGVVYAKEVIGFIPDNSEITGNEIRALRSAWPEWSPVRGSKCVVLVDEILTPDFVEREIAPLLPSGWSVEQVLRTSYGIEAYRQLAGAGLCILYNLPKQAEHYAKLWALPSGCPVLEFQNELKVEGGCQHLASVAELNSWILPLHKGTVSETRDQLLGQVKDWFLKHGSVLSTSSSPLHLTPPPSSEQPPSNPSSSVNPSDPGPNPVVPASSGPTGMFLSV